jgi:hypothetical protein
VASHEDGSTVEGEEPVLVDGGEGPVATGAAAWSVEVGVQLKNRVAGVRGRASVRGGEMEWGFSTGCTREGIGLWHTWGGGGNRGRSGEPVGDSAVMV